MQNLLEQVVIAGWGFANEVNGGVCVQKEGERDMVHEGLLTRLLGQLQ